MHFKYTVSHHLSSSLSLSFHSSSVCFHSLFPICITLIPRQVGNKKNLLRLHKETQLYCFFFHFLTSIIPKLFCRSLPPLLVWVKGGKRERKFMTRATQCFYFLSFTLFCPPPSTAPILRVSVNVIFLVVLVLHHHPQSDQPFFPCISLLPPPEM